MRSKCTTAAVMLVAVLAMSAVAASAASAAMPEFKPGTKQTFTSKISSITIDNTYGETALTCNGGKTVGEIVNATQVGKVVVTLTGCGIPLSGLSKCHTSGKGEGEVVTNSLKGELGVSGTTAVLGLESEKTEGVLKIKEPVAVFYCGVYLTVKWTGGLIGQIGPIRAFRHIFEQDWTQAGGVQKYKSFEGSSTKTTRSLHLESTINKNNVEELGVAGIEELTFVNEVEIT